MIFITLGSQKFQFNRLLEKIDKMLETGIIDDVVYAQRGNSTYIPKNYDSIDFLNRDKFGEIMDKSNLVITHAGTGAIIGAVKRNKKVIAVPRKKEFNEHVDDHQVQIVKEFSQMKIIEPCYDVDEMEMAYRNVLSKAYATYQSNTEVYINTINNYLESL